MEAAAAAVVSAKDSAAFDRAFHGSAIPMAIADGSRRYIDANRPARLMLRTTLAELQKLRVDDLTPPDGMPVMQAAWHQLETEGVTKGVYTLTDPGGGSFEAVYYAVAAPDAPQYVIAASMRGWSEDELSDPAPPPAEGSPASLLSPRELEVVKLIGEGLNGEEIAVQLGLSPETIRTHLRNAMRRTGAKTRAHLVALVVAN